MVISAALIDEEKADVSSDDDNQLQIDDLAENSVGEDASFTSNFPQTLRSSESDDNNLQIDCSSDLVQTTEKPTTSDPMSPDSGVPFTEEFMEPQCHVTKEVEEEEEDAPLPPADVSSSTDNPDISVEEGTDQISQEDDREEGELEEGELEDDESMDASEVAQPRPPLLPLPTVEELSQTLTKSLIDRDAKRKRVRRRPNKDGQRKHRTHEDSRKKRKLNDDKEKPLDFDALLKEELLLKSTGNAAENLVPEEDDDMEGESGDGSEDEQKRRRRTRRSRKRSRSGSQSRKSDIPCMFYSQGSCQSGAACQFSHDISKSGRKMELCKFYMMDCCAKKDKCLYLHKDFPCKYYHFGMKCQDSADCKFSHNPLQDPTKAILLKHIEHAPKDILGKFPRLTKAMAHSILEITLAVREKNDIEDAVIESTLEMESTGFKYLDRAIRDLRKRTGIPKIDKSALENKQREEEKDKHDSSPRKRRSNETEDRKEHDKDKPRERDKDRDRHRDRHRDRGKDRGHDRDRHRSERKRDRDPDSSHGRSSHKEVASRDPRIVSHSTDSRPMDTYNDPRDSFEYNDNSARKVPAVETRDPRLKTAQSSWYPSDEDSDSRKRTQTSEINPAITTNLATSAELTVDYGLLQNVLQTVQTAQSSFTEVASRDKNDQDHLKTSKDFTYKNQYDILSDDIRDVFDAPSEPVKPAFRTLNDDLTQLIRSVKEKTTLRAEQPTSSQEEDSSIWPYDDDERQAVPLKPPTTKRWVPQVPPESLPGKAHLNSIKETIEDLFPEKKSSKMSLYDVDLRELNMPTAELEVPFSAPMESFAIEIDGMDVSKGYMQYALSEIYVPKPDLSNLHIDSNDSKSQDDPRIRKILESLSEGPESPPAGIPTAKPPEIAPIIEAIPNRDPRAQRKSSPTPHHNPHTEQTQRVDPRTVRSDPRIARKESEPLMEHPMETAISGIPFPAPEQSFFPPSYSNIPGPFVPGGGDPRGRPGLLGPAPGHKPLLGPMVGNPYVMDAMGNPFPQDGGHFGPMRGFDPKSHVWQNQPYQNRPKRDRDSSYSQKMS